MQKFGEMCITTYGDNTHQAKLANQGTLLVYGLAKQNIIPPVHIGFLPQDKKDYFEPGHNFCEYTKVEKPVLVKTSYEG